MMRRATLCMLAIGALCAPATDAAPAGDNASAPVKVKITTPTRGATAMGMGEGTPVNAIAEILDEKPLYEFFLDAGGAAPEAAAVGGR